MPTSNAAQDDTSDQRSIQRIGDGRGITLAVIVGCQLMIAVDGTVMNVALPSLRGDLGFTPTSVSWVLTAYTLAFGGLLLLGGRVGDILGRRNAFILGLSVFTLASLLGGLAPTAGWLLAARAIQGIGAAMAGPNTLALLSTNFEEGMPRNKALGVFSIVAGLGLAIGLIVGGALTEWASWRWVLLINVPIGFVIVSLTPRYVRQSDRITGRFDTIGALVSSAGMTLLVYALIQVAALGWSDGPTLATGAAGIVLLVLFVLIESRAAQPIMPLRLFADRTRAFAYVNSLLLVAAMISMFFFLIQFLQDVLNLNPILSGLCFLPMALSLFFAGRAAPNLIPRLGATHLMVIGAACITVGVAWLATISSVTSYVTGILGPTILFGIGIGFSFMPLNMTILAGLPPRDAGAASGLLQAMQQAGGSVGLATLVTVFGAVSRSAAAKPATAGQTAVAHAHAAEAAGMAGAFLGAVAFAVCALLIATFVVRNPAPPNKPATTSA